MRKILSVVLPLFLISVSATAQNHSGSWHSDDTRSGWSDGTFPKGFSLTIDLKFEGNKLIYHSVNDTNPAAKTELNWSAPLDGTPTPIAEHPRFNQVSVKQLGPDEFQILELKDGDVMVGALWRFLPDGKTVTRWGIGKSVVGKSRAFTEYFDRQ